MYPLLATAASLMPSSLLEIEYQLREPADVRSVHVAPESSEV